MSASRLDHADPALRVVGLSKTYATRVVDEVTWQLGRGRVHALLGGNGSGKSTLLKMLAGVVPADPGGTIELGGRAVASEDYGVQHAAGHLRFVHQDLGLVDDLSIADNFGLAGGYPRARFRRIDDHALVRHVAAELQAHGLDLDPRAPAGSLRPTDRALVALARALDGIGREPTVLVLDEPTASLPVDEVEQLFSSVRALRDAGHSVVFVSHRLSEVAEIADDVTVLRDGRIVGAGPIGDFSEPVIVELMAGHPHEVPAGRGAETLLGASSVRVRAEGLRGGPLAGIDLCVGRGEILGVAGLVGSGRSSLLRVLFGDLGPGATLWLDAETVQIRTPADAVRAGVALVPEDRQRDAAYLDRPVWENLGAAVVERYRRRGGLSARAERAAAPQAMAQFRVRAPSAQVPLSALSGGNQQKVILARWMQTEPRLLLLDEPTQGVDAVARDEIHELVRAAAHRGTSVVVVSSDLEELESLSHRVLVMLDGRAVRELSGSDLNRTTMTTAMHEQGALL